MFFNKKNFLSFLMPLIAVVFMAVVAGGCGGGGGDSPSPGPAPGPEPSPEGARYTPGEEKILVEKKIGALGGVIEINAPGTPVDGVKIDFPAGALPDSYDVGVGYDTGTVAFKSNPALADVPILVMNMAYKGEFANPVKITVPMRDKEATPVPYYIDGDGKLQAMSLTGIDRAKGECSFVTFHASKFTVPELKLADIPIAKFNMAYQPSEDGFQITNVGSTYNSDGECFGMSAFSMWYSWGRKSTGRDRLYGRFMEKVGEDREGNDILGQDVVATRSHTSVSKLWQTHYSDVASQQIGDCTSEDRFVAIAAAMIDSVCPIVMYIDDAGKSAAAHAILAYGYSFTSDDKKSANIHFYDPNHPGDDHLFVNYRTDTKEFGSYEDFTRFAYLGQGDLKWSERFESILAGAMLKFNGSGLAKITLDDSSPKSGEEAAGRNIVISGKIDSVEVLADKMKMSVRSVYEDEKGDWKYGDFQDFEGRVDGDSGKFAVPVSLNSGVNQIVFTPSGTLDEGRVTLISHDWTEEYLVTLSEPSAKILVTLTWGTDDTDIDLYVKDPTGDYSCFYHRKTADGGVLDYDVTTGYGPEHWTLKTTDTIRYGAPYKVRLHYFSDNDKGPSNYTVKIRLNEGEKDDVEYTYSGALVVSNSSNDGPDDTGADWADIAEIVLPAPSSASMPKAYATKADSAVSTSAAVPNQSERAKYKPAK